MPVVAVVPAANEESILAVLARVECRARGGRLEEAVGACRDLMPRLIALNDPVALEACHQTLALCLRHAERLRDSAAALPSPVPGLLALRRAMHARRAGEHERAAEHLARAFEVLDDRRAGDGHVRDALARAHLEASLVREALQDWRGALDSYKQHARVREGSLRSRAVTCARAQALRLELERYRRADPAPTRGKVTATAVATHPVGVRPGPAAKPPAAPAPVDEALDDALTGLPTRHRLARDAARLASQLPDASLTLLVADIDHFKRVNDAWSRATGDAVLQALAQVLRAQSRPHDLLARLDGEKFVVALGGVVSMTRATLVAERLRTAIEAADWSAIQPGLAVTASIGVSVRAPGEALDEALARADLALRECKLGGRNQVRCSS